MSQSLTSMTYTIRKAEIEDAQKVAEVHVRTWQSHYRGQIPDDHLAALSIEKRARAWAAAFSDLKPRSATFVSDEAGDIHGFCSVGSSRDVGAAPEEGELLAIYVNPANQGIGIGTALMEEGLAFLCAQNFTRAHLWVLDTNERTIGFYRTKGWKADGAEKKEHLGNVELREIRLSKDL